MNGIVKSAVDWFFKFLELLVVIFMVAMVVMVFGNVILRYGFNSGITVSVEMSRYCFIWLTYVGAMVAMRDGAHIGVDTLIRRLPLAGKRWCFAASQSLMLMCNVLFFIGTWKMHEINATTISPVVMNSPASRKNGTASSGKLSAPSTKRWAMIWLSKAGSAPASAMEPISATPHTSSA